MQLSPILPVNRLTQERPGVDSENYSAISPMKRSMRNLPCRLVGSVLFAGYRLEDARWLFWGEWRLEGDYYNKKPGGVFVEPTGFLSENCALLFIRIGLTEDQD